MKLPEDQLERIFAGESPIRIIREFQGLSLVDLGRRSGLSADYLGKCEEGRRGLSQDRMAAVAEALGVHPLDLKRCNEHFSNCDLEVRFMPTDES